MTVLRWINRQRKKYDIGPPLETIPKGYKHSVCLCPLAVALNSEVFYRYKWDAGLDTVESRKLVWKQGKYKARKIPKVVQSWVERFDEGHYPQLKR